MGFAVVLVLMAMVFGSGALSVAVVKWVVIATVVLFAAAAVSGYTGRGNARARASSASS